MKKRMECDFSWIKKRKLSILYSINWKYDVYYGKKTLICSDKKSRRRPAFASDGGDAAGTP